MVVQQPRFLFGSFNASTAYCCQTSESNSDVKALIKNRLLLPYVRAGMAASMAGEFQTLGGIDITSPLTIP